MLGGEIAAAIGVERLGNPADVPARIVLAPDRLAQCQRGVQGGGGIEREEVARHGATVVVQDHGEPGLRRGLALTEGENIQETVISLPDRVGGLSFATTEEIEALLVGFCPVVRQRCQGRGELPDNGIHESVAGRRQVVLARQGTDLAVDERNAQWWRLQGQTFDALVQHKGEPATCAPIAPGRADEPGQTPRAVALYPPAQGAERALVMARQVRQCGMLFEKRPHHLKPRHRLGTLVVSQLGQHSAHPSSSLPFPPKT
jgi:hypothetical protein